MDYEHLLLLKVLKGKRDSRKVKWMNLIGKYKVSSELFDTWESVYDFISKYNKKYSAIPELKVVENKFSTFTLEKTPEPLEFYIEEVRNLYKYRSLININQVIEDGVENESYDKTMANIDKILAKIKYSMAESADIDLRSIDERIDFYDKKRKGQIEQGVPTGWPRLDEELGGGHVPGDFTVVFARIQNFKSWVLLSWAEHAWNLGFRFIFFTREMSAEKVSRRMDSIVTHTRFKDLKTGTMDDKSFKKFSKRLLKFKKSSQSMVIGVNKAGRFGVSFIRSKIEEYKPDIVFIDSAYLLTDEEGGKSDWERQTHISRGLRELALNLHIPIVASVQENRGGVGSKTDKLRNIAYSDSWGQDAENAIWLGREWDRVKEDYTNNLWVRLSKIREGENIRFCLELNFDNMEFHESNIGVEEGEVFDDGSGEDNEEDLKV